MLLNLFEAPWIWRFSSFCDIVSANELATWFSVVPSALEISCSWIVSKFKSAIFLFAFSTMISWSYYGLKAWTFLFGKNKISEYSYKLLFLFFIVIGSSVKLGSVLDFSDMMILGMAFPNILGLYFFAKEVKFDLKDYFSRIKSVKIKKFK